MHAGKPFTATRRGPCSKTGWGDWSELSNRFPSKAEIAATMIQSAAIPVLALSATGIALWASQRRWTSALVLAGTVLCASAICAGEFPRPANTKGGKWGYANSVGVFAIEPRFDYAYPFYPNGLAKVRVAGQEGFIDLKGKFVLDPQYVDIEDRTSTGLLRVRVATHQFDYRGNKYGFISPTGKVLIERKFDWAELFSDN